jgi:hypothetical protein
LALRRTPPLKGKPFLIVLYLSSQELFPSFPVLAQALASTIQLYNTASFTTLGFFSQPKDFSQNALPQGSA